MSAPFADDAAMFLADFGVDVVASGATFKGIFNTTQSVLDMGGLAGPLGSDPTLLMSSDDVALGTIAVGCTVTVDGTNYIVRSVLLLDDAVFTQMHLQRA